MADIALLYDRAESDELGIRLTAKNMGIELGYIPFYKIYFGFCKAGIELKTRGKDYSEEIKNTKVVMNRTQSKSRRMFGAIIFDALGKKLINSLSIEYACQSKLRTLLALSRNDVNIPKTVFVPANVYDYTENDKTQDNIKSVANLIIQYLGETNIVVKPDAGTHGNGVSLAVDRNKLESLLGDIQPSIINPSGVVAQELIPKWFYDMRIIVSKEKNKPEYCPSTCLVRAGFKEFRTNTFLGNMVFKLKMPDSVREASVNAAKVLAGDSEAWVLAMDAMPYLNEDLMVGETELKKSFNELVEYFKVVQNVKNIPNKKVDFDTYSEKVKAAYERYMNSDPYHHIQSVIQETLEATQDKVVFHEGNSCPEFWEQTRLVGGINVAELLLRSAKSLI